MFARESIVWPKVFRHWKTKVAEFSAGRAPQSDDEFLAACGLPPDPDAARYALAVRKIFAEMGSVDRQFILATDRYPEDLAVLPSWDSIDLLDLTLRLEEELRIKLPGNPFPLPFQFTVSEFVRMLTFAIRAGGRPID